MSDSQPDALLRPDVLTGNKARRWDARLMPRNDGGFAVVTDGFVASSD
ncbi:hypothetical protein [Nitrosospira sp. Nsp2]|nr:hypothetical protein [Nitrosospira sp. Nsp2]